MTANIFAPHLFHDKVILITGAAGGVGGAVAELLGSLDAKLVLTDFRAEALTKTATGLGALSVPADIRSVQECEGIIGTTLAHYGRLDALVNCAGIWVEGRSEMASEEDWAQCIDVNLKGTFFMCSRAIPPLKASQGAIVNIASVAGLAPSVDTATEIAPRRATAGSVNEQWAGSSALLTQTPAASPSSAAETS